MIPVANRPILEHILEALETAGVEEVRLVVGANRQRVQNYFGNGQDWAFDISYVVQDQQLGTGHAILQAESKMGESFLALNGDRIIDAELIERVWERHQETSEPTVSVTRVGEPSQYGVVKLDDGKITAINEKPRPERTTSEFVNAGVYAFSPEIFAAIRHTESHGEQKLTDTLSQWLTEHRLQAVTHPGLWLDVSEPWDLLSVNEALLTDAGLANEPSATIDPTAAMAATTRIGEGVTVHPQAAVLQGVTLGDNVRIGAGAIVENTVILSDVTVNSSAVLTDCIVGANATIGANTTIKGGPTDVVLNDEVYHDVTFGGLLGDNVAVGANVTVQPGAIVGTNATVGDGTFVGGRIDDGAHVTRG
jgi:glucose-1-phosphate thymidylyltransferase